MSQIWIVTLMIQIMKTICLWYMLEKDWKISHKGSLLLVSEPESVCMRKTLFCVKNKGKYYTFKIMKRVSGEVNEKSRSINKVALFLGYRKKHQKSKFTQKEACNEQVLTNRSINDSRQTSSTNKLKGFKECFIDLSPISKDVLSNLIHDSDSDN